MDNVYKIDEFLKIIAAAAKMGKPIDSDTVYNNLIFFGLEQKRADISMNFENWISRFANNPNINVFVAPNWKYFCQFVNRGKNEINTYESIKLYIPLDKEHVYEGANMIFDYLARENIKHVSKIGKRVRFDNVVIRVNKVEDANKIMNFINNTSYLREGFTVKNPFAIQDGIVSMAWDGALSYNSVVSAWVSQYIEWEKQNNKLDNVSYSRFFAFVQKKSVEVFEKGNGLSEMIDYLRHNDLIPRDDMDDGMLPSRLLNYYDVTNLMLRAITPGMKKEELYDYIELVSSNQHQRRQIDRLDWLMHYEKKIDDTKAVTPTVMKHSPQQKAAYLLAFKYMCEKYGYDRTKGSFSAYAYDGLETRITSYKGARRLFIDNGITKEIAGSISKELYETNLMIESSLNFALLETNKKYGSRQVYDALRRLLHSRDFCAFTNNRNGRVLLKNSMKEMETPLDIKYCLMDIMAMYGVEFNFESVDEICEQYYHHFNEKIIKRKK